MPDLDADRAFFDEHGWVVLRGVVPPAELERLRAATLELMPDARVPAASDGVPMLVRPALRHVDVQAWLAAEAPFRLAARLLGARGVRLLQDALLVKPTGADATLAWHRDATYFGYLEPLDVVSVRLALGDETPATGCMWVIDASHRWSQERVGVRVTTPAFGADRVADGLGATDDGLRVPIVLGPGDVSLHHALTFHASFSNRGAESRRTLVTHVAADHCRVVYDRLPPEGRAWFPTDPDARLDPGAFWPLPLA